MVNRHRFAAAIAGAALLVGAGSLRVQAADLRVGA